MPLLFKLSLYWFLVTGALGVIFPFYTLYLKENIYLTGSQVGFVFATTPLVSSFAQPLWGQVADLTGMRTRLMGLMAIGAAVGYALLTLPQSFVGMLLATALLAIFSSSLLPMGVSVSLATMEEKGVSDFGRVRVWGTIGFLFSVVSMPLFIDKIQIAQGLTELPNGPSEPGLEYIFLVACALVALASLVAWTIPRTGSVSKRAKQGDYWLLIRNTKYLRVLLFVFCSFLCIQGPMVLFPVFIRSLGGDMQVVSHMWIWMLLLEIPLVHSIGPIIKRIGPRAVTSLGIIAGGCRWLICALATDLTLIYPLQLLHAFFVAGIIVGTPLYVEMMIPEQLRSTGQGLLTTVGMNIGGVLSISGCGILLDCFGPQFPYMVGGVGAILIGSFAFLFLPKMQRNG